MNRFKITGYNRYADRTIILEASSQKSALTKMLKTVGIKFTNVIKLTNGKSKLHKQWGRP